MASPATFVPDETSDEQPSFSAPASFVPDEPSQAPAVTFSDPAETIAPLSRWKSLKLGTEQALEKVFHGMAEKGSPSPVAVASQAAMIAPLGLPERLGKLLMGYFTARTAYDQPAIARQIRDEVKQGDLPAAKRTAIEDLLNIGMVGTGIMGLRGGKQPATEGEPPITEVVAKIPEGAKPATFIPETPQPIGGPNARDITSATSVLEPEIRPRVGEEAPLRQQGTPAGTQEPLVERPPQGGARADEGAAPPIEPVKPSGEATTIRNVGDKLGFTYDGDFGLGDVKLHQFTFRNLPKSDPAYGASFYAKQGASPEEILALADKKAAAFREAAPKKSAAPSSPTPSETPTAPVAPSGIPVGERQPAAAVKPAAPAQGGVKDEVFSDPIVSAAVKDKSTGKINTGKNHALALSQPNPYIHPMNQISGFVTKSGKFLTVAEAEEYVKPQIGELEYRHGGGLSSEELKAKTPPPSPSVVKPEGKAVLTIAQRKKYTELYRVESELNAGFQRIYVPADELVSTTDQTYLKLKSTLEQNVKDAGYAQKQNQAGQTFWEKPVGAKNAPSQLSGKAGQLNPAEMSVDEFNEKHRLYDEAQGERLKKAIDAFDALAKKPNDPELQAAAAEIAKNDPYATRLAWTVADGLKHHERWGVTGPSNEIRNRKARQAQEFIAKQPNFLRENEMLFLQGSQKNHLQNESNLLQNPEHQPRLNADAVDKLGVDLPEGYVKEGEFYVFKSQPPPPKAETPAVEPVAAKVKEPSIAPPELKETPPTIKSPLSAFGKQFYKNTAGEWRQKGRPSEKVNASRVAALEQLLKPKEPAMAEVGPGLGAAKGGEPPYQPLSQLTDSLSVLAKQKPQTDSLTTAFSMGKVASAVKDRASSAINGLEAVGQYLKTKAEGYPVWNSWKAAIGDRHLALTQSVKNAKEFVRESQKTVPDKLTQEAISDYIDAGGKDNVLAKAEAETKPQFQAGYAKARNLSPDEKAIADNAKDYFDRRLQDAIDHGILEDGIEDYIHRIYPAESPLKSAILSELKSGIFTGRPALAKQRVYEYDYEAEKAGLTPVKSFIKRIADYDLSLNRAIANRQAVKAMTQIKMPDGRPMVDVGGIGTKIEGEPPKGDATLIRPSAKTSRPDDPKNDRGDYRVRDYAALKRWKWVSADGEGNPIFVKGDVLVHPDAVKQIDNLFKRSAIRQNPVGRAALAIGSTVKQTMLDLSGFHPVQITVHGWEHRTFKPVDKIDFDNHDVRGLVRGGLVVGETTGHELFSEGLSGGGSSLTRHIPVIGQKLQAYNHWLFNDYIPRLKVATGLHALARNRSKYPKLSDDELYHLTANQMNNAFGELNYDMIGRSKTTQDVMRLALLAPDFLEARAGFAGQAATKFGSEQRTALLLGFVTIYMTARIINKLLDGEYHFEPKNAFSVVVGKKAYSLRTVQGDVLKAAMEPGRFISSRLNPVYGRTLMEAFSGRDYFGRQRSGLQQLKDLASTIVPISGRGLLNPREQNLMESFLNAFGITNRRSPATADVFQLAANFKKAHNIPVEPGEFVYDPDKDPYYGIKQAAVFSNVQTTESEIKKAIKAGHPPMAIWKHFVSYSSRPFAGNKKNDALFYKELSDDNKKIYADAVNERKVTVQRFKAAWHLAHQQSGEGLESETQQPSESPLSE